MEKPAPLNVLIVDDEKNIRSTLTVCLEGIGCAVKSVSNGAAAVPAVRAGGFQLALVNLRLAHESGLELIPKLLAEQSDLLVILITAYADLETAVESIKRGAWDFLAKPFTPAQIRHIVDKANERLALGWRIASLETRLAATIPEADLESRSSKMRSILELIPRIAASDASVLLRGENGTGKGVIARALHVQSARAARPFVTVSCPTLTGELLASELFGHVRGAFTDAVRDQQGRVETAEGGTLFLDEIADISPAVQAKLLRFLQEKEFERIGESHTRRADVRIVAATNSDLEAGVAAGRFREDLFYRLNVVELRLPGLRERPEDIVPLAERFLSFFAGNNRRTALELSDATRKALAAYAWPGNIRELRNTIERAVILWPGRVIEPPALPEKIAGQGSGAPALGGDFTIEEIEREHIARVVARTAKLEDASAILGIDSSTLYRKRKRQEQ